MLSESCPKALPKLYQRDVSKLSHSVSKLSQRCVKVVPSVWKKWIEIFHYQYNSGVFITTPDLWVTFGEASLQNGFAMLPQTPNSCLAAAFMGKNMCCNWILHFFNWGSKRLPNAVIYRNLHPCPPVIYLQWKVKVSYNSRQVFEQKKVLIVLYVHCVRRLTVYDVNTVH